MQRTDPFRWGVLILAAGASRRMGRSKLLLPWGSTTVLGHLLLQWRHAGADQIAVVHAPQSEELIRELERLQFPESNLIINPEPERGMFSSIQSAAAWTGWKPEFSHYVMTLGDQPHLADSTLRALLAFSAAHQDAICQPAYGGRPRHPVVLPRRSFLELADSDAQDLKMFLNGHSSIRLTVEIADPGLDLDIDTPEDYERLRPV